MISDQRFSCAHTALRLWCVSVVLLPTCAWGGPPSLLTYQGRLKESGLPVTSTRSVLVGLCTTPTPAAYPDNANCAYTPGQNVSVVNGLFRSTFTAPVDLSTNGGNLWLQLVVAGQALSPLEQLTASPYALYAATAAADVLKTGDAMTGPLTLIGSTLTVAGGSFSVGGSTLVVSGGYVGIGTASPALPLDVNGGAQFGSRAAKSTFSATTGWLTLPGVTPSNPQDAATKAYVDSAVPASAGGWTNSGMVVEMTAAGDNVVVQSTLTVQGNAFSVGGSTLVASGGSVGIGTASPVLPLDVNGGAQFGSGPIKSTFTAAGNLQVPGSVTGSTFYGDGSHLTNVSGVSLNGIDTTKLATDAVDSSKILNGAINTGKLANDAVTASAILSNSITFAKIGQNGCSLGQEMQWNGSAWVCAAAVGNNSIDTTKLAVDSVDSTKILNGAVHTGKLAADAVTGASILSGSIDTTKLAAGAVNSAKILDGAVSTSKLATDSVLSSALINDAGGLSKVTAGAMMMSAGKIGVGTTAPATTLDVNGGAQFGSGAARSTFSATTGGLTFSSAYSPSNPQDAATVAYVATVVPASAGGFTRTVGVPTVYVTVPSDNVVIQSTLTVQGNAFSVGGSTLAVSGGNVGIGTASPTSRLEISPSANADFRFWQGGGGQTPFMAVSNPSGKAAALLAGTNASGIIFDNSSGFSISSEANAGIVGGTSIGGTAALSVQPNGNVGIGTTSPVTTLDVNGGAQFGSGAARSTFSATGSLTLASGQPLSLSGAGGYIVSHSSIQASAFFGDGSQLTNISGVALGTIDTAKLAMDSVDSTKILNRAVNTNKLANDAVTTSAILNGNVTAAKLFNAGVFTGDVTTTFPAITINASAINTGKLANDAVTAAAILNNSVTFAKIGQNGCSLGQEMQWNGSAWVCAAAVGSSSIDTTKLASDAVTTSAILNGNVTAAKLANAGVFTGDVTTTFPAITINANAINTGKLATDAVTANAILNQTITGAKIANNAITSAQLNNVVVGATKGNATTVPQLTYDSAGRITGESDVTIAGVSPVNSSLASGNIWVGNGSAQAAAVAMSGDATLSNAGALTIAANAVNTGKLNSDAVTAAQILNGAVQTAKLAVDAVTAASILAGSIDTTKLAAGAVNSAKILDGAVSTSKLATDSVLSSALINDAGGLSKVTAGAMTVSAGKVGIGTLPLSSLDVAGGVAVGAYAGANSAPANDLIVSDKIGIGTSAPLSRLHIDFNDSSTSQSQLNSLVVGNTNSTAGNMANIVFSYGSSAQMGASINTVFENRSLGNEDTHLEFWNKTTGLAKERMHITKDGKVGIGTSIPGQTLTVGDASAGNPAGNALFQGLATQDISVGIKAGHEFDLISRSTNRLDIRDVTASANRLTIDSSGNVGIGTASPALLLDINGGAQFGSGATRSTFTAAGNLQLPLGASISAGGSTITLNGSGFVGIQNASPTQMFQVGGGTLVATTSGNVGIGTASPGSLLHVHSGVVTIDGTSASAGLRINAGANTGTLISGWLSTTSSSWSPLFSGIGCFDTQITLSGAIPGNECYVGASDLSGGGAYTNLIFACYVNASNTVMVRLCNLASGGANPSNLTFRVTTFVH